MLIWSSVSARKSYRIIALSVAVLFLSWPIVILEKQHCSMGGCNDKRSTPVEISFGGVLMRVDIQKEKTNADSHISNLVPINIATTAQKFFPTDHKGSNSNTPTVFSGNTIAMPIGGFPSSVGVVGAGFGGSGFGGGGEVIVHAKESISNLDNDEGPGSGPYDNDDAHLLLHEIKSGGPSGFGFLRVFNPNDYPIHSDNHFLVFSALNGDRESVNLQGQIGAATSSYIPIPIRFNRIDLYRATTTSGGIKKEPLLVDSISCEDCQQFSFTKYCPTIAAQHQFNRIYAQ